MPDLDSAVASISPAGSRQDMDRKSSREDAIRSALLSSIATGSFVDTRFYLPSRRSRAGYVTDLRAVYANSMLFRRASDVFDNMLTGGFAESMSTSFDGEPPSGQEVSMDEYGYETDSDLDDTEDDESVDNAADHVVSVTATPQSVQPVQSVQSVQSENVESNGITVSGDGDIGEITDHQHTQNLRTVGPREAQAASASASASCPYGPCTGRTVVVKDMAHKTWIALIAYIYTGSIEFSPLRSSSASPPGDHGSQNRTSSVACSPKSMYRLADKYGLEDLQGMALKQIRSGLSTDNILKELFSTFTSRYPEVQQIQVDFLCDSMQISDVMASMPGWMAVMAQGHLPHSQNVMSTLLLTMATKIQSSTASKDELRRCPRCVDGSRELTFSSCGHTYNRPLNRKK
ncbi:uncharacterized protein B0H18DRAFT_617273 [Fomitopsis serialis]|uniref:uncharacterized protein n=1 Tax=Fomitopsis serialis TaxID=139415 RepID=UPI00200858FC|nr:uncharacterized protein B0H18DRAFT_617273 [Neoantrodia serialis]KAH9920091.1 hypothetical protein B0H18DRAFT_617273 [Neoantrodia serialis]